MANPLSNSNFNSFNKCRRKFYFEYIVANAVAKDPFRKEVHYLKQLTNRTFWAGNLVEAAIEDVIIREKPSKANALNKLQNFVESLINQQFSFSLSNQFRDVVKSKIDKRLYFRLFEHEYELDDSEIKDAVLEDVLKCFQNYFNIRIEDCNILLHDLLLKTNNQRVQQPIPFKFMERTIRCIPDYIIPGQSKIILIDWKVSKSFASDFSKQLLLYLFAVYKTSWGVNKNIDNMTAHEVNLYNGQVKSYKLSEENILFMEDYIFDFMQRIDGCLQNRKFEAIDWEDFPCTENFNSCHYCNFQKLCYRQEV